MNHVCGACGQRFYVKPSQTKRGRGLFCSRTCAYSHRPTKTRTNQRAPRHAKAIPLTRGYVALVDAADYPSVAAFNWSARSARQTVYAQRRGVTVDGRPTIVTMHRQILGATDGEIVDHRDGNGLDNRRRNLRFADSAQNRANSDKSRPSVSRYKGVTWHPGTGRWRAKIIVRGVQTHLGLFDDEATAAHAYDAAAVANFGTYARPNFT